MTTPSTALAKGQEIIKRIVDEGEVKKKTGDLQFAKTEYEAAIETYNEVIASLAPIRPAPGGETLALRCLLNQMQCFIKLNQFDKALNASNLAITVPSAAHEIHLLRKIFIRRGTVFEALEKWSIALNCIDRAISLDAQSTELDASRERIIAQITSITDTNENITEIPSRPNHLPAEVVTDCIKVILQSHCSAQVVLPMLQKVTQKNVYVDMRDERNNNVMWAVCNSAIARASTEGEKPDDVLPVLTLLLQFGSRAEQRYPAQNNKTPLQMMAIAGAVECAKLLLKYGASVHAFDDAGWTPLMVACSPKHPRLADADGDTSNDDMVELLLEAKSNPNHHTLTGLTPLSSCAQGGDVNSLNLLINADAKLSDRCTQGFSPVVWAMIGGNTEGSEVMNALMETLESTPELLAEMKEDMKCVEFARLVLGVKMSINEYVKSQSEEERKNIPNNAHLLADKIIRHLAKVSGVEELGEVNEFDVSLIEKIHKYVMSVLPSALLTRFTPIEDPTAAVNNATPLDRCHLSIIMTSATGPTKEPYLAKLSNVSYFLNGRYPDYRMLILQPIQLFFSLCIASQAAVDSIVGRSKSIVHYRGAGSDFWMKLLVAQGADVTTVQDLPEESSENANDWRNPLGPLLYSSVGPIESVTLLASDEVKDKTLFALWPHTKLPTMHVDDPNGAGVVQKMLDQFVGSKVAFVGEFDGTSLCSEEDAHEYASHVYLTTHFTLVEALPLENNWQETSCYVTYWEKK